MQELQTIGKSFNQFVVFKLFLLTKDNFFFLVHLDKQTENSLIETKSIHI